MYIDIDCLLNLDADDFIALKTLRAKEQDPENSKIQEIEQFANKINQRLDFLKILRQNRHIFSSEVIDYFERKQIRLALSVENDLRTLLKK